MSPGAAQALGAACPATRQPRPKDFYALSGSGASGSGAFSAKILGPASTANAGAAWFVRLLAAPSLALRGASLLVDGASPELMHSTTDPAFEPDKPLGAIAPRGSDPGLLSRGLFLGSMPILFQYL